MKLVSSYMKTMQSFVRNNAATLKMTALSQCCYMIDSTFAGLLYLTYLVAVQGFHVSKLPDVPVLDAAIQGARKKRGGIVLKRQACYCVPVAFEAVYLSCLGAEVVYPNDVVAPSRGTVHTIARNSHRQHITSSARNFIDCFIVALNKMSST